jgi:hypothetical protein
MTSGQSFVCSHSIRVRQGTDGRTDGWTGWDGLDKQRDEEKLNCTCHILPAYRGKGKLELGQNGIEQMQHVVYLCIQSSGGKLHDLECFFFFLCWVEGVWGVLYKWEGWGFELFQEKGVGGER